MNYISVSLIDKSQILIFYQSLATQATSHNVFIRPHAKVTVHKGVIPVRMIPESQNAMAMSLYMKFCQNGTISPAYTDALNLFATTADGFEFLQLLLQHSHSLLLIEAIATIDIPK